MKLKFISLKEYIKEQEEISSDEEQLENPESEKTKDSDLTPEREEEIRKALEDQPDELRRAYAEAIANHKGEKLVVTSDKKLSDQKIVKSPYGTEVNMDDLKKKIESAKTAIVTDSPLFGPYVRKFIPIFTWELPTMATDGIRLFVNPEFGQKLNRQQTIFVILHEILHCVLLHIQRFVDNPSYNMNKFNIAADYEINAVLVDEFKADGFDEAFVKELKAYYEEKFLQMPVEKIYNLIPDSDNEENCSCGGSGEGSGEGKGQCTCRGGGKGIGGILTPDKGKAIAKRAGYSDDEIGQEKSLNDIKKDWKEAAIEINRRTKMGGGGDMGALRKKLAEITKSEINWRQVLRQYAGEALSQNKEWRLGNRKWYNEKHIIKPGLKKPKDALDKIVVCVDTSGSVDDITLHRMLNEITQIIFSKQVNEIYVIFFDNSVVNAQIITPQKKKLEPFGGGGTNFQMPLDWIHKKLNDNVALCLFMTDGYEKMPKEPKRYGIGKKFIWMIYNNDDFKHPFGVKILMGDQKKK